MAPKAQIDDRVTLPSLGDQKLESQREQWKKVKELEHSRLNKQRQLVESVNPHTIFETDSFAEKGSVMSSMCMLDKEKVGLSQYSKSKAARAPSMTADNLPPDIPEENENAHLDEDEFQFGLDKPVESGLSEAGDGASDLDVEMRRPKGMSQQRARGPASRLD
mmetsp:Transcript_9489/g.14542  ORF Transcript_9489/g.14542 Transcript_9489/m.14542 type:complete len:163 (+) Transcript_9489:1118-1606(+)